MYIDKGVADARIALSTAEDEPPTVHALLTYQRDGRAWVDVDDRVDDAAHIEQVSVHPDHAGQGRGRELIETAARWAGQRGLAALTLTTFAHVPWNAPYYARLGFTVVPPDQWPAGLQRIREHEADLGLDAWPRVAMRRALTD
ncbi:GNAT family N-acetyltransferase [Arthrobacter echini]|uniref:GNAT family N-acetyltransferase n=1 Tax=Arthrobacter echini TaxID=1529066 RepID=A0A4S5E9S4_9MICC|nr:GNAT family N-acetyltransferase [Arthrobacter echini]THJ68477.1 GNAT family N-acetyltransferase [Arthrobacter echini]